jgi:hypothetical protein
MSVPGRASTKSGLGGLGDEDCHCCNLKVLFLWLALVEMVVGCRGSSWGTRCWAQESWEVASNVGSCAGGMGWRGLLPYCRLLEILERLGQVLEQLKNSLTFVMPSPMTSFIPDSADLRRKHPCQPSLRRVCGGMPTSAWRLCTGVAL